MIEGSFNPVIFWGAAIFGAILYITKIPSITLGIGLYLPFGITMAVFIGGMIRYIVNKVWKKQTENGTVIASGLFGGESFVGVIIAFLYLMLA
jgi:uncharacterized oligopeptide transporter (OPT) family protein